MAHTEALRQRELGVSKQRRQPGVTEGGVERGGQGWDRQGLVGLCVRCVPRFHSIPRRLGARQADAG